MTSTKKLLISRLFIGHHTSGFHLLVFRNHGCITFTEKDQNKLNYKLQIQYEAARIVTGATRLVSIISLLTETGWETLSARKKNHKLVMFYKMRNNLCPVYLSSLVPRTIGSSVSYNLRNAGDIQTVNTNTQLYYTSFLPSAIREWNDLPGEIQNANSIAAFKYNLKRLSNVSLPPLYYSSGNRTCQIYHTRIRTNCSSLN